LLQNIYHVVEIAMLSIYIGKTVKLHKVGRISAWELIH